MSTISLVHGGCDMRVNIQSDQDGNILSVAEVRPAEGETPGLQPMPIAGCESLTIDLSQEQERAGLFTLATRYRLDTTDQRPRLRALDG